MKSYLKGHQNSELVDVKVKNPKKGPFHQVNFGRLTVWNNISDAHRDKNVHVYSFYFIQRHTDPILFFASVVVKPFLLTLLHSGLILT